MQRELDERPEMPAAAAAAPEPSVAAGPDPETLSKLEEIDDKLVGLSSLDAEVRKLRERVEELERRPAAEPAPAPAPAERQAAKPVDPLAEALAPEKASAPAPVPDMPVVEPAVAKAPSFQPMDFKVETFEKVELTAPAPQPLPALAPAPSMELTQPPPLTPPASEPPSLTPPPTASPFGAPAPAPLPALTPLPIQLGAAPEPAQSPFTTPPPPFPSAFPSAGPTPLAEFVHSQPPTPFPSMVGDKFPEVKPPEITRSVTGPVEMVTGAPRSGRSGKKAVIFLAVIVFLIGLGLIGSLYLDTKRITKGGTNTGPTGVEKTGAAPGLSGSKPPKNLPVSDPMPEIAPADFSQSAVDLVKSFTAPGGRASLGEQLDRFNDPLP